MREDKKQTLYKIIEEKGCFKNQCAFCPMDPIDCGRGILDHINVSEKEGQKAVYENAIKLREYMKI